VDTAQAEATEQQERMAAVAVVTEAVTLLVQADLWLPFQFGDLLEVLAELLLLMEKMAEAVAACLVQEQMEQILEQVALVVMAAAVAALEDQSLAALVEMALQLSAFITEAITWHFMQ
jgi:hypothetical protein